VMVWVRGPAMPWSLGPHAARAAITTAAAPNAPRLLC
jgi:hypothetical protein